MLLEELVKDLQPVKVEGNVFHEIRGIKYDSRQVEPGDLFICVKGFKTDGHLYASSAINKGAVAIVAEKEINVPHGIALIKVADTRAAMADLAARFYGFPSRRLKLVGVTGTNGKTTTAHLIRNILKSAGFKVALFGTISNTIGDEVLPAERTTPEAPDLQRMLDKAVKKGAEYAVMEVSSHALELERVRKCSFYSAVFTNISRDHLDFHTDFSNYLRSKKKLFSMLSPSLGGYGVVNNDDRFGSEFETVSCVPVYKYSIQSVGDVVAEDINIEPAGASFVVKYPGGKVLLNLQLTGIFSVYNSLAAFTVAWKEGVEQGVIKKALEESKGAPGRFEKIECNQDFTVIVDYAHTPDGLENVLRTARDISRGKIITVFGCGGDRDRTKRPLMGEAVALRSDICIVTSDNPRSENPVDIIKEIIPGIEKHTEKYYIEPDRRKAIELALQLADKGDIVIIAGKGHETYQEIKGVKHPFDDREVVRSILCKR